MPGLPAFLRPVQCEGLIRLGNPDGDGGYIIRRADVERCSHVLSLGLGLETSFDKAITALNPAIRLIAADHTVPPSRLRWLWLHAQWKKVLYPLLPSKKRRAWEHAQRSRLIGVYFDVYGKKQHRHLTKMVSATPAQNSVTIDELMAMTGNPAPHSVIVKMDIEGAEYDVVADVLRHHERISTIAIEIHSLGSRAVEFESMMAAMLERYAIVHVHGNNCSPLIPGTTCPDVVELTLVHRELLEKPLQLSTHTYPRSDLDVPNSDERPDYPLEFDEPFVEAN
jgi:hypothetical protein